MQRDRKRQEDIYEILPKEDPVSSQRYLDQILERFDIDLNDPINRIILKWKTIVDPSIAAHSVCQGYKNGTLYIICDHPSRASYIRMNSKELIKTIQSVFPEVELKKIVTRVKSKS